LPDNIVMTENEGSGNPDESGESQAGSPFGQPGQYDGGAAGGSAAQPYGTPPVSGTPAYGQPGSGQPAYGQPGYSQPGYGQPGYGAQFGDVIVAGPAQRNRRLAPVITSVVAVLAIILAGGGFAAYKLLASSGSQPDKWAPANSIAYAKIDLNPSASAKVAAWEFEKKFPDAPKVASADQLKDALLSEMFASDPTADVNYDTDIKPWLGDRLAIAAYPDAAGKPTAIGIIEVKDAGKARAGLEKIKASSGANAATGYSVQGDYVIVGQDQPSVDAAVAAARKSNITSNHNFSSDLATLKGDRIVSAWWDLSATVKSLSASLPPQAQGLLSSGSLTGLPSMGDLGRVVMGVRVQPSYVELEGRVLGSKTTDASKAFADGNAVGTLGDLPGGSVMGVALANPEQLIKTELSTLSSGLLGASLQSELDQAGAQLGVKLPGDVENLLGSGVAIGLDSVPANDPNVSQALFTLLSHPDDVTSALHTAKILASLLSEQGNLSVTAAAHGSSVVMTNDTKPGSGKLADDASFKTALSGVPAKSVIAGYVNIGALAAASPAAPAAAKHLDGLGFYVGTDASSPVFGAKLTIK